MFLQSSPLNSAPGCHERIANEFVERARVFEDHRHHFTEVFVEKRDYFGGIQSLGVRGEALEIREKSHHFFALTPQGLQVRVRIVRDLLHNVFLDVAFQRGAHPAAIATLERDVTGDPCDPADQPGQ